MANYASGNPRRLPRTSLVRGLRFRLAVSFLLFFTVLVIGVGFLVRQILVNILYEQSTALLEEEWAAMKGYLRIENQRPEWFFDRFDPEEALIASRIQRVYFLTDSTGYILNVSPEYDEVGPESSEEIKSRLRQLRQTQQPIIEVRKNKKGIPYMIRAGIIPDEDRREYYLAIGRPMSEGMRTISQFSFRYAALAPLLVLLCGVLGWMLAGRALDPVKSVARAAQRITGSNLKMEIPTRGAGDELDYLIVALNRMVERLNTSFEQMRQFSTDVSHELRTPLTGIRGQLEVALFTAETPEQYRDAMVNALQDVEKLSNIVRALLLLSQAESGQLVLQRVPLDVSTVVEDIVEQFQIPAEAAGIKLTCTTHPACEVFADRIQIERLLSNLLSNALKYTPEGGNVHVALETGRNTDVVRLTVRDTGIGIPAEQLPQIFNRFYRVRSPKAAAVQGLGLGLSFVSWIAQAHGGKIEVESTEGQGSRFTVILPLHVAAPAEAESATVVKENG